MALALMSLLGTPRRIVETWLYIEVGLVMGTGILGLGHHYFWIGTPQYWLAIGGFFSAFEPLPLLGMVVHAVYDAGTHHMKTSNRPAFYWVMAEAFGNFIGAGVWGFMITLPQVNLYAHGTQWTPLMAISPSGAPTPAASSACTTSCCRRRGAQPRSTAQRGAGRL
jgi:nitric oxide reductase subunit B